MSDYPMVIYPCNEGGFVAEIPALPGCLAQGETMEEAIQELITIKALWLETAWKHKMELPDIEEAIARVKMLSAA